MRGRAEEDLDARDGAPRARLVQRRLGVGVGGGGIRARGGEDAHDVGSVRVRGAVRRRRGAGARRGVHGGAAAQEEGDALGVALARGVVQRGVPAVAARAVRVRELGAAREERAEFFEVAALRRRARAAHELHLLEALVVGRALVVGVAAAAHPARTPGERARARPRARRRAAPVKHTSSPTTTPRHGRSIVINATQPESALSLRTARLVVDRLMSPCCSPSSHPGARDERRGPRGGAGGGASRAGEPRPARRGGPRVRRRGATRRRRRSAQGARGGSEVRADPIPREKPKRARRRASRSPATATPPPLTPPPPRALPPPPLAQQRGLPPRLERLPLPARHAPLAEPRRARRVRARDARARVALGRRPAPARGHARVHGRPLGAPPPPRARPDPLRGRGRARGGGEGAAAGTRTRTRTRTPPPPPPPPPGPPRPPPPRAPRPFPRPRSTPPPRRSVSTRSARSPRPPSRTGARATPSSAPPTAPRR